MQSQYQQQKLAIIGAGLAGATLANALRDSHWQITVFEKSRGSGGRMASSRLPSGEAVDLGASYFDSEPDSAFTAWLQTQSDLHHWQPETTDFTGNIQPSKSLYVHQGRQSGLCRQLLAGCQQHWQTRVAKLKPGQQRRWQLIDSNAGQLAEYDAVIITAPAEQTRQLLPQDINFRLAETTKAESRWCLILELNQPVGSPSLIVGDHPILGRCICESDKPGRHYTKQVWHIEASASWSERYKEAEQKWLTQKLLKALAELWQQPLEPSFLKLHRWLYSSYPTAQQHYHWDSERQLGCCGDWLSTSGAEGAWESATRLARLLI